MCSVNGTAVETNEFAAKLISEAADAEVKLVVSRQRAALRFAVLPRAFVAAVEHAKSEAWARTHLAEAQHAHALTRGRPRQ